MEITIGITEGNRHLTVEVEQEPDAAEQLVTEALAGSVLKLTDTKGRRVIVPTSQIAYVEIGPADGRRVGFDLAP